ncbi:unnamed protein product, partial [marine sediment metagenome]
QVNEQGQPFVQMQDPHMLHGFVQTGPSDFELRLVNEYQITFRFIGRCGDVSGDKIVFSIPQPDPPKGFWANQWRYFPFVFSFPHQIITITNIFFPVDYEPLYVPENWGIEDSWGSYIIEYKTTRELEVEFNKVIQQITVEKAAHSWMPRRFYSSYIDAINEWALRIERPLVIQRVSQGE